MTNQFAPPIYSSKITPVILAGGKGSRLWPASRPDQPKQFIKLQGGLSLFQRTLKRCQENDLFAAPIIVVGESHLHLAEKQVAEIDITPATMIVEPMGRDTAAAITFAALAAHHDELDNQIIAVFPSDHQIQNPQAMNKAMNQAASICARSGMLMTFGIVPEHASSSYGYIRYGASLVEDQGYLIDAFIEKPDHETAQSFLDAGNYLWNSGIFMYPLGSYLREMNMHGPEVIRGCETALENSHHDGVNLILQAEDVRKIPKISIDYLLMESTGFSAVVPVDPMWKDMGSWDSIWDISLQDSNGNGAYGDVALMDSHNCYAHSTGPLTTVVGLNDCMVVSTPDAVLVTAKNRAAQLKYLVDEMRLKKRPEVRSHPGEIRPWGRFAPLHQGATHQVKVIEVDPNGQLSLQKHQFRAEHWIVVKGKPTVTIGETVQHLSAGDHVHIPIGEVHRLENFEDDPVLLIEVQTGTYFGEDDIIRLEDIYNRQDDMPVDVSAKVTPSLTPPHQTTQ